MAIRRRFIRPLLGLAAAAFAAACTGGPAITAFDFTENRGYVVGDTGIAARYNGGSMPVFVSGSFPGVDPASLPAETARLLETHQPTGPVPFAAQPWSPEFARQMKTVIAFNPARRVSASSLCRGEFPETAAASGGRQRVQAAFCRGRRELRAVTFTADVSGGERAGFEAILKAAAGQLYPPVSDTEGGDLFRP